MVQFLVLSVEASTLGVLLMSVRTTDELRVPWERLTETGEQNHVKVGVGYVFQCVEVNLIF